MTSMIESVARAMWATRRENAGKWLPDGPPLEEWGDGSVPKANGVMDEARAAIEAMREPTEAMVTAGGHAALDSVAQFADARDAWQAMIDKALEK